MKSLLVVLSSVRPNSAGDNILAEVQRAVATSAEFTVKVADFRKMPLPFFDSPDPTASPDFVPTNENVKAWIDAVRESDAMLILVAEYNRGFTGVIKNALDWVPAPNLASKPIGMIGYGWSGGSNAAAGLRAILTGFFNANPVSPDAQLAFTKEIAFDGSSVDQEAVQQSIVSVLEALETALRA